jgi:hypothetical protein
MSSPIDMAGPSKMASTAPIPIEQTAISGRGHWPTFFVVGAQKCGTTTLYEQLSKHGQVFVPEKKEPEFFTTGIDRSKMVHKFDRIDAVDEYQNQFQAARSYAASGDFSTGYLWDPAVPAKIRQCTPNARIIIMLRDPVMRANSAYLMLHSRAKDTAPSLREAVARDATRNKDNWFTAFHYVDGGMYYEQVKRYLETFGRGQVLVGLFEDLLRRPLELFSQIAAHIGISAEPFASMNLSEAYNTFSVPRTKLIGSAKKSPLLSTITRSILPEKLRDSLRRAPLLFSTKKPALDVETRKSLQEIFQPDLVRLEQLLGRELPELRSQWI